MNGKKNINQKQLIILMCLAVLCIALPFFIPTFWLRVVTGVIMWVGLALSWNLIGGYMGYTSFGHGAFFGIGAYITALLMTNLNVPFFAAIIIAGILTYVFSGLIGYPTLRLSGTYFAIGTWAFAEMMRQLILVIPATGGPYGLRLPVMLNENFFYFLMLGLAILTLAFTYFVFEKSSFGLKVEAVREEETAAKTLGLDTVSVKVQTFAISAMFAGIFGGAYGYWITYIHPDSVLGAKIADMMVVMVLMGGIGTVLGPAIGAIVLAIIDKLMWVAWGDSPAYLIILGLAICMVVLFMPEGLLSLITRAKNRLFKKPLDPLPPDSANKGEEARI